MIKDCELIMLNHSTRCIDILFLKNKTIKSVSILQKDIELAKAQVLTFRKNEMAAICNTSKKCGLLSYSIFSYQDLHSQSLTGQIVEVVSEQSLVEAYKVDKIDEFSKIGWWMVDQTSSECISFSFIDLKEKGKIRKVVSDVPLLKYFIIGEVKIRINSIWQLHKNEFIINTSSFGKIPLEQKVENKDKYANCFKIAMLEDKKLGEIIPFT